MNKALLARYQRYTKKKKNKKKITLRCMVIGTCAGQFFNCIPLYRNKKHYATLNRSVKTSLRAGGTYNLLNQLQICFWDSSLGIAERAICWSLFNITSHESEKLYPKRNLSQG